MINRAAILSFFIFAACDLPVNVKIYEEKYTLFANLDVFLLAESLSISTIDTVFISSSSEVESGIQSEELYVSGAQIALTGPEYFTGIYFIEDSINPGRYYPAEEYLHDEILDISTVVSGFLLDDGYSFSPGNTYTIQAIIAEDTLTAQTTLPESLTFNSQEGEYNCDGMNIEVNSINWDNFAENIDNLFFGSELENVDTLFLRTDGCYVGSFASYPYFYLGFDAPSSSIVRTVTFALEADSLALEAELMGLELAEGSPLADDLNCNGVNDSVYANLFYDWPCSESDLHQNDIFKLWKGHYYDSENRLFFQNPFIWVVETTPIPMMWLYYNYYGLQLILVQATDEAYYDYLSGDPLSQNQLLLPDSNVENGFGLFSSTLSRAFFVYTVPFSGD